MKLKVKLVASEKNHLAVFEGEGERFSAQIPREYRTEGAQYEAEFDPVTRQATIILPEKKQLRPSALYRALLSKLDVEIHEGRNEGDVADKIRDQMDIPWRELADYEVQELEIASALMQEPVETCPGSGIPIARGTNAWCPHCQQSYHVIQGKIAHHARDTDNLELRRTRLANLLAFRGIPVLAIADLRSVVQAVSATPSVSGDSRSAASAFSLAWDSLKWTEEAVVARELPRFIQALIEIGLSKPDRAFMEFRKKLVALGFRTVPKEVSEALHEEADPLVCKGSMQPARADASELTCFSGVNVMGICPVCNVAVKVDGFGNVIVHEPSQPSSDPGSHRPR